MPSVYRMRGHLVLSGNTGDPVALIATKRITRGNLMSLLRGDDDKPLRRGDLIQMPASPHVIVRCAGPTEKAEEEGDAPADPGVPSSGGYACRRCGTTKVHLGAQGYCEVCWNIFVTIRGQLRAQKMERENP